MNQTKASAATTLSSGSRASNATIKYLSAMPFVAQSPYTRDNKFVMMFLLLGYWILIGLDWILIDLIRLIREVQVEGIAAERWKARRDLPGGPQMDL
mmetsp:Transcript_20972/g.41640  ORF Transcript_20972/g.41640 Transcript_20972/m.41640 type:complete len:97 (-) Transcript_20972:146-436(-)